MAIKSDEDWENVNDLIQYAKQHPGELKYGHGGIGTINHLVAEIFGQVTSINIQQVPFRGAGEIVTALLGGHVQLIFVNPILVKEHVRSGTIRVLAVADNKRLTDPLLSNIPLLQEVGVNIAFNNWQAIAAPKELPSDVKNKLIEGFKNIINDPEFKKEMGNTGTTIEYLDHKALEEKWISQNQFLSNIIKETGILDLIKTQKK